MQDLILCLGACWRIFPHTKNDVGAISFFRIVSPRMGANRQLVHAI